MTGRGQETVVRHSITPLGTQADDGVRPQMLPEVIPCTRADAFAYPIFARRDLHAQKRFLVDFGMEVAQFDEERLFMKGAGGAPHLAMFLRGRRDHFVGFGFTVPETNLEQVKSSLGGEITQLDDRPGGGEALILGSPGGHRLELVTGWPRPQQAKPVSEGPPFRSVNEELRRPAAPAIVVRAGHAVLKTTALEETFEFFRRAIGMIPSDVQYLEDGSPAVLFLRLDRGPQPTDHHSLVLSIALEDDLDHVAYEVPDLDAVGLGHQHLRHAGWKHSWGIGRHWLGSQIFDYWRDPCGAHFEHYADSDKYTSSHPTHYSPFSKASLYAWGPDMPESFLGKPSLGSLLHVLRGVLTGKLDARRLKLLAKAAKAPPRPWIK